MAMLNSQRVSGKFLAQGWSSPDGYYQRIQRIGSNHLKKYMSYICIYIYIQCIYLFTCLFIYISIYIHISRITPYVSHLKPHQIPTWSMLPSAFRAASSSGCALPKSAKLRGVYLAGGSWGYLGFPIYLVDFMENIWFMENKKVVPGKSMFSIFFQCTWYI